MSDEPACSTIVLACLVYPGFCGGTRNAPSTYMKPAPPVTRMFFASGRGSNLVVPVRTGACFQSSSVTYDRGFRIVEFLLSVAQA